MNAKVKEYIRRLKMWKHKFDYSIHQNPDNLLVIGLIILFVMETAIVISLSIR